MHLHYLEREEENPRENTLLLSSQDGTARQSCCCNFENTLRLLTFGELGEFLVYISQFCTLLMPHSCVFGEMFKGKPILTGNSDLNQAQLIFSLVGTPTEENMPGWSQLPGCEGVKNFGYKRGNLHEFFREYVLYISSLTSE
jgi:hypothetical protein